LFISNWPLSRKLAALVCSLLIPLMLIEANSLLRLKTELLESKKAQVKEQVQSAYSIIDHFYKQAPTLGTEKAKELAFQSVAALRYGKNGYFWINDMDHNLVMHPIKTGIIGKNMADSRDASGKHHWREMVNVVSKQGEGFVEYTYKGPQFKTPKEKVSYVKGQKEWGWVVGSGIYLSDVQEIFMAIVTESLALVLLVLTFTIFACWFIVRDITTPIHSMLDAVKTLSSGDMTHFIDLNRRDEIGQLSAELNNMTSSLRRLLVNVDTAVSSLTNHTSEMRHNTLQTCEGMDRQFGEVNQLAAAMEEMTSTIQEVANNAQTTSGATQQATHQTETSQHDVQRSVHEIQELSGSVESANTVMNELNRHTSKIGDVVSVIREISEQTNLLALNAAIEAARAGEAGRGFAVVADEVRSLASRTQSSTGEIEDIIEQLQKKSATANDSMQFSQQKAQQNAVLVEQTGSNIATIVEHINCVNDMSNQIATAAEQQSLVAAEISNSLTGIRDISENVVSHAHEITQNSEQVDSMARELGSRIATFKLH